MTLRLGSLCTGYGGLDLAVASVLDVEHAWVADVCKFDKHGNAGHHDPCRAPCTILAHRFPGVPNLGDIKAIDWEYLVSRTPDLATTQAMYDRYCAGLSLAQVARDFNVSRQTVYTRFKRRGLDLRERKAPLPFIDYGGRRFTLGQGGYYRATEGDRAYLHRTIWTTECGPIPDDWDVHHVDHDKTNNALSNLRPLSKADHTRLHAAEEVSLSDSHRVDVMTAGYPRSSCASPSHTPGGDVEQTTPATSGLSSVRPFASYDRCSRSWRTWTAIAASDSTEWSGTWPKSGCMSDGLSYRLPEWEPRISGSVSSSQSLPAREGSTLLLSTPQSRDHKGRPADGFNQSNLVRDIEDLMPTPRAGDGEKGGPNQRGSSGDLMLPSAVTCLPTPTSRDWKDGPPCANVPDNALLGRVVHQLAPEVNDGQGFISTFPPDGTDDVPDESKDRAIGGPASGALLPTPAVNDMGAAYTPETWDAWTARMKAEHNNGNGHGASLNIEAQRLDMLPTPSVADGEGGHETRSGARSHERLLPGVAKYELLPTTTTTDAKASGAADYTTGHAGTTLTDATIRQPSRWGKYAAAIARWEAITRPAPEPTNITDGYLKARAKRLARLDRRPVGMRGSLRVRRQLAAAFSEWMMGVPLGWITKVPGITRNEALKAAGNGVVPQQAAEALRFLLTMPTGRQIAEAHEPDDLLELLAVEA